MKARGRAKIVDGVCYDAHVFEEVFTTGLLYSTILHSSLLHRQLAPTLTATVSMVPGYVWEEQSARYTRDDRWWPALVVTEGVV